MVAAMALGLLRLASVVVDAAGPSRSRVALRRLRLRFRDPIITDR
ncbi:MAG TPA: hypothetical protein VIC57_07220 [Candidatus Dormibacteraeota bacterium]|jgi:hypothetical protein